jgi:hypothetical protein
MATRSPVKSKAGKKSPASFQLINHPTKGMLMKLKDIKFAPRPAPGEELTLGFFNPRPEEEVNNPETSEKLRYNLRIEGLIEPPAIRLWTDPADNEVPIDNCHIAGERRLRRLNEIYDQNLLCADYVNPKPESFKKGDSVVAMSRFGIVQKQEGTVVTIIFDGKDVCQCEWESVVPTICGNKAFEWIEVKIYKDISDERAMRIAFAENDQGVPLSVKAEILLVERYLAMVPKKTQQEVAHILNSNITFVSQRASFRKELPALAFEKLMNGDMAANVAVNILSRPKEQREAYFAAMLAEEELTTEEVIRRHRLAMEKFEDDADLHADAAKKAAAEGDDVTAQREKKKAASAERKAKIERDRKARAEADAGKIRAGHASRAQTKTGITARKGSMLNREQIEEVFVKGLMKYITEEQVDQVTGETIPCEDAAKIRRFALAILSGNTDFVSVLREYYVSNDVWTLPAGLTKDAPPAKKGKPKPCKRASGS